MRVLVISDSAPARRSVASALEQDGHLALTARTTAEASLAMRHGLPDLIVVDLEAAGQGGLSWCQRLRAAGSQALVMALTPCHDVPIRLAAFEAGVDDCLPRPFALEEFRARVRALGRRRAQGSTSAMRRGDGEVNFATRRAWRSGAEVTLTTREWGVLECLWAEQGRMVARASILGQLWGNASKESAGSLEVIIGRIRKKLGPDWIRTMRREGYALSLEQA